MIVDGITSIPLPAHLLEEYDRIVSDPKYQTWCDSSVKVNGNTIGTQHKTKMGKKCLKKFSNRCKLEIHCIYITYLIVDVKVKA